jgi:putative flippase GtrA
MVYNLEKASTGECQDSSYFLVFETVKECVMKTTPLRNAVRALAYRRVMDPPPPPPPENVSIAPGKFSALSPLFFEFFRYLLVGGSAFVIDIGVLYVTKTYLFNAAGNFGVLCATALGFLAGLVYNYFLSTVFVFKKIDENARKHKARFFIVFAVIGIIGLGLTEVCMYMGTRFLGRQYYLVIKTLTAALVLMWNYIARKTLIFKGEIYAK